MSIHALVLSLVLAAEAPKSAPAVPEASTAASAVPGRTPVKTEPPERYRMALGGPAGHFSDWEKFDLERFFRLTTWVRVGSIHGKPSDKWASAVRVNLIGPGDEKTRPVVTLVLQFDRKTRKPLPYYTRSGDDKTYGFQVELDADKAIRIDAVTLKPGKLLVAFNEKRFEVDMPFEVKGLSVVASGLDAAFEPFELTRRAP